MSAIDVNRKARVGHEWPEGSSREAKETRIERLRTGAGVVRRAKAAEATRLLGVVLAEAAAAEAAEARHGGRR
jgi:hypothetical protein